MISKDNFIFVYNIDDSESKRLAQYYATLHRMSVGDPDTPTATGETGGRSWEVYGQTIGIQCYDTGEDRDEILLSLSDFETAVTNPLKAAIAELSITVWGIILGYNVPGGFVDGEDIISSTSRISNMNAVGGFSKKTDNPLFNRSVYKRFDADDAEKALIVSRIDGPNSLITQSYIDNGNLAMIQNSVNGKFYIDPFSDATGEEAFKYTEDLIEFNNRTLPLLNIDSWSTTFLDPYIDVIIPYVLGDSFVWSWIQDKGTPNFFQPTDTLRSFFYNADYSGGSTIKKTSNKYWPYLAMNAGYVATAGSMSNPTISGFLQPTPFFQSLLRKSTIGEAFLFSVPHLDWTITLFGDPLPFVNFPAVDEIPVDVLIETEGWELMSKDLSRSIAYLYKRSEDLDTLRQIIVDSQDIGIATSMLHLSHKLAENSSKKNVDKMISPLSQNLLFYPSNRYPSNGLSISNPTINTYLGDNGIKISKLITNMFYEGFIDAGYNLTEGYWEWDFLLQNLTTSFTRYHFELTISDKTDFSNILHTIQSWVDYRNWEYEKEPSVFSPIPLDGVSSNLSGRTIKYKSSANQYLTRNQIYYFKIKQYDESSDTLYDYDPVYSAGIIYT